MVACVRVADRTCVLPKGPVVDFLLFKFASHSLCLVRFGQLLGPTQRI